MKERIEWESGGKAKLIVFKHNKASPCRRFHDPNGIQKCQYGTRCTYIHMPEYEG